MSVIRVRAKVVAAALYSVVILYYCLHELFRGMNRRLAVHTYYRVTVVQLIASHVRTDYARVVLFCRRARILVFYSYRSASATWS